MTDKPSVTVRKRPLLDEYAVPAVALSVTSDREDHVRVHVVESLPRSTTQVDVGFHPDHGSDAWSVLADDRIAYEATVPANGSVGTHYAVATSESYLLRRYMGKPSIEVSPVPAARTDGAAGEQGVSATVRVVDRPVADGGRRSHLADRRD